MTQSIHQKPKHSNQLNRTIRCGISPAFYNKSIRDGYDQRAYGNSFQPTAIPTPNLIDHITTGKGYTLACFNSRKRTKETFKDAQLLGLDLDDNVSVQDCLDNDFIANNAFFIGATASSGEPDDKDGIVRNKTRVLFYLDTPVTSVAQFERYQQALQYHCADLRPDPACKDASRMFYGSDTSDFVTMDNVLSLATMEAIATQWQDVLDDSQPRTEDENTQIQATNRQALSDITDNRQKRNLKYARVALDNNARDLASMTKGARNTTLYKHGAKMGNFVGAGMIDRGEVENALHNAGESCGLSQSDIKGTLPHAISDGEQTPFDLSKLTDFTTFSSVSEMEIDDSLTPVDLATSTTQINQQYIDISLDDHARTIFLKSAMGTGKSYNSKKIIREVEENLGRKARVIILTHSLNLIKKLQADNPDFTSHIGLDPDTIRNTEKLIITPNSLHHLLDDNYNIPNYDLFITDEPAHVLEALNSNLLDGTQASDALNIITTLKENTPKLLIMDAYLSQLSVDVFKPQNKPYEVIENTYKKDNGAVISHVNIGNCLSRAIHDADRNNSLLVVATESNNLCDSATNILQTGHGLKVLQVNGNASGNDDITNKSELANILQNINEYAIKYDAIVHTSAISSGFSIEVEAVFCGLFDGSTSQTSAGLTANDYAQMTGRTRNKTACHIYVKDAKRNFEQSANAIEQSYLAKTRATKRAIATVLTDTGKIKPVNYKQLKMHARNEKSKNIQASDPRGYTHAYLFHDGYTVETCYDTDKRMTDLIHGNKELRDLEFKTLVLDPDTDIITNSQLRQMKLDPNGQPITQTIIAGNLKSKIQAITDNATVTEQQFEDLKQVKERSKVYRLANHSVSDEYLAQEDKHELQKPMHLQHHRLIKKRFDMALLTALFDTSDLNQIASDAPLLSKQDFDNRMSKFNTAMQSDKTMTPLIEPLIKKHNSQTTAARAILRVIGLKLKTHKKMKNGNKFLAYSLDPDTLNKQIGYVESRLDRERKKEMLIYGVSG